MTMTTSPFTRLPHHLDPFGLIAGPPLHRHPRLRFITDGGDGAGAGGDGAGSGTGDGAGAGSGDGTGDEQLGPAGVQAYERTKNELRGKKAELRAYADLGLTPDEIKALVAEKNAGKQPDEETIRKTAERDAQRAADARLHGRLRTAEVRTQAAELGFNNPLDALALLPTADLEKIDVADGDIVDSDAVKKLLTTLATDRPYLLKDPTATVDFRQVGIGGAGSGPAKREVGAGLPRLRQAYESTSKK
ncbi:hypothetical protein GRS96_12400 [Rathayibacter sp. VKM Ac-2803]|uniref:hypothetical protein n=1 Tax=Rathayibacter sp. VKM Ac-2803 TaxID=2609256 RepID=UPI001359DE64|nr:hypothetical protein [Rathayibacter sp. VKM Ac-2803]MWV50070.1 hypothetical protein [Rathayibacter sp. VKM Ac-2803]